MATQMKTLPVQIIGARRITVPKSPIQVIINIEHLSVKFSSKVKETLMKMVLEMSVMMIKTMMVLNFLRRRKVVQRAKPKK